MTTPFLGIAFLAALAGPLVSLVGGIIVKKLSKAKDSKVHEVAAPVAAVAFGIAYEAITGQTVDPEALAAGTGNGALALLLHKLYYEAKPSTRRRRRREADARPRINRR